MTPLSGQAGCAAPVSACPLAGALGLHFRGLQEVGAGNIGLVALLIAPVSAGFGALLLHERLPADGFLGTVLLLTGLVVLDGRAEVPLTRAQRFLSGCR